MAINTLAKMRVLGLALVADDTLSTGICSLKRNAVQRITAIPHSVTRNQFGHPDSNFLVLAVNPSHVLYAAACRRLTPVGSSCSVEPDG